jgi:hypothetical protein
MELEEVKAKFKKTIDRDLMNEIDYNRFIEDIDDSDTLKELDETIELWATNRKNRLREIMSNNNL